MMKNQTTKKVQIEYDKAIKVARELVEILTPYCEKIQIAGSLRRKKLYVSDIELVLIPKPFDTGLFKSGIALILDEYQIVKGRFELNCKYTQRIIQGIKTDIFIAENGNWGSQLAIRTGPAKYSHKVLGVEWSKRGYKMEVGYLTINGRPVATPTEEEFFKRIGVEFKHPTQRKI